MRTIALFGGTGQTGKEFLKIALEGGYKIKALARNPEKSEIKHNNLEWTKGDVFLRIILFADLNLRDHSMKDTHNQTAGGDKGIITFIYYNLQTTRSPIYQGLLLFNIKLSPFMS